MWTLVVIKANPVANNTAGMFDGFESVPMGALFFKRSDPSLDRKRMGNYIPLPTSSTNFFKNSVGAVGL